MVLIKKSITLLFLISLCLSFKPASDTVHICNNKNTSVYHVSKSCKALTKCKHEIINVTKTDAVNKYGKRACKICS